jgi:hypothetical protein
LSEVLAAVYRKQFNLPDGGTVEAWELAEVASVAVM